MNIQQQQLLTDTIRVSLDSILVEIRHNFSTQNQYPYLGLLPKEIANYSLIEQQFTQAFDKLYAEAAIGTLSMLKNTAHTVQTNVPIQGVIRLDRLKRIAEIINKLARQEKGQQKTKPNWAQELQYVLAGGGLPIPVTVMCDVLAVNTQTQERFAFEVKSPLPNSDVTKVSKEKIFKLHAMDPPQVSGAYFALSYNPYGARERYDWSFPARWFNMKEDSVVLIGDEFWDMIGGRGTYQFFIKQINEIGQEYRERIYREYLGMEPPEQQIPLL
ncbi:MAG: TdeIII family type II restriction endonuclease [Candidatus Kapaibacteriota bacterium]|jgi:hypothetical protein